MEQRIRHIATTWDGSVIAVAEFEKAVEIWDVSNECCIARFNSVLDYGGHRLVIHPNGSSCFAAAYNKMGLACYDCRTGSVVWKREDIKRLQNLSISTNGECLYCGSDYRACLILDTNTGAEIGRYRSIRRVFPGSYQTSLLESSSEIKLFSENTGLIKRKPKMSFALLSAAFSPALCCYSESGSSTYCLDVNTGQEIWRYNPEIGSHILSLSYNESDHTFSGIEWPFQNGGNKVLVTFDSNSGQVISRIIIGEPIETSFCSHGSLLITSDGDIFNLKTGNRIRELNF